MKDKYKYMLAIVAVLAIIGVVGGGTYAYWTWISNTAQRTNVNFTLANNVSSLGLAASIEGNGSTTAQNLKPTPCTNTSYAIVKTVPITYKNETNQAASLTAKLSVTSFTWRSSSYVPSTANLGSLKWAVRRSAASSATTSNPNTCSSGAVASGSFNTLGTLSGTSLSGTKDLGSFIVQHDNSGTLQNTIPANTAETTVNYYLYIWLDYNYAHENVGGVNSDPMQGLNFTVQWSGTIENA